MDSVIGHGLAAQTGLPCDIIAQEAPLLMGNDVEVSGMA